ncbi:flagellar hook-length control protein FliK [Rhodobium gokarnense]|uniref:Flagellar hook-length control protein-like C-terminal domain-containing protein n=1 Tax=Rhodobium gokarnense TaxID=364296 RepID=A0ABT3HBR2_9HYPH|nr:flagellar hook-length control protein FliK [Rhodobium gokarnense]MCW2307847.1 hypothetical protein [Rhodobium gokarnense]
MPATSFAPRSAPVVSVSAQAGAAGAQGGQLIAARVVEVREDGSVRLATRDGQFSVKPTVPLEVGTRLMLQIEGAGSQVKLVLHADAKPAPSLPGGGTGTPTGTPTAPPTVPTAGAQVPQPGGYPAPLPAGAPLPGAATAVQTPLPGTVPPGAIAQVVSSGASLPPGGSAPTAAPAGQTAATPATPTTAGAVPPANVATSGAAPTGAPQANSAPPLPQGPVPQAAQGQPAPAPAGQAPLPQANATPNLTQAAQQAAAYAARAGQSPSTGTAPQTAAAGAAPAGAATPAASATLAGSTPLPPSADAAARAALSEMVHTAASRQDSLAPLFANLSAVASHGGNTLPDPVMKAVQQLLGLRLPANAPVTGEQMRLAVQSSGIFQEAHLASGQAAAASGDMKSALMVLRNVLTTWLGADAAANVAATTKPGARPGAPRKAGTPVGQRAAAASLTSSSTGTEAMRALLSQANAALDRVRLSQFASRADDDGGPVQAARGHDWTFEIPLALGRQTPIAQFRIARDEKKGKNGKARVWRVQFSMDFEPMGAINGQVALCDGDVSVTVFAEREETSELLRGALGDLRGALSEGAFGVEEVQVHTGTPDFPAGAPGAGTHVDTET